MMLMNNPFVTRRVEATGNSLVAQLVKSTRTSAEIVEQLYLSTLLARHYRQRSNSQWIGWKETAVRAQRICSGVCLTS